MKSIFGNNLIISLFGESHGELVGVTLNGLPSGLKIDNDFIKSELKRRLPSKDYETKRLESDDYEIVSGVYNGFTTGAPLTIIIKNHDVLSKDYEDGVIRPGTSDYPSYVRTDGFCDMRGSGHFSGRLTSPIVACGAILKNLLKKKNIEILSITPNSFQDDDDSHGFMMQVVVKNMPVGVGEPFFDSVESILSHLIFSIPSVKGVSFGDPNLYELKGSQAKDELRIEDNKVKIINNHNGGINGGLTNGNDIIINVYFKPIASISAHQKSINIKAMENIDLKINGRHDKTIINRVPVVVESMVAIGLVDMLISFYGSNELK